MRVVAVWVLDTGQRHQIKGSRRGVFIDFFSELRDRKTIIFAVDRQRQGSGIAIGSVTKRVGNRVKYH